jgi:hypothetical protein
MRDHDQAQDSPDQDQDRERGAALVIVLIFMIGIAGLVAFVLPTSIKHVQVQGQSDRMRQLQIVLQHGISDAVQEMMTNTDPDGNGIGCVGLPATHTAWIADGDYATELAASGTVVTAGGRQLGAYFGVVVTDATDAQILHIMAAYPDFSNPENIVGARVRLEVSVQGLFGDRNAISFAGNLAGTSNTGAGNFGWQNNGDQTVIITAPNPYDSDGDGFADKYAPAVNVSDPTFYTGFLAEFVNDSNHNVGNGALELKGGDINDLSTATGSLIDTTNGDAATDTIAQQPSSTQRVNETFLAQWIDHWREPGSSTPDSTHSLSDGATHTYTDELVVLNLTQLTGGTVINGSGTLVLKGSLTMKGGAKINWTGDVIVLPTAAHGNLIVKDAELNVTGSLVLAADPTDNKKASLSLSDHDSKVNVTGALLALQAGTGNAEINVQSGGKLEVDGLMGLLGDNIAFQTKGCNHCRASLNVQGSTVIAVPNGGSGLQKLRFDSNSDTYFEFDNAKFEAGVGLAEAGPNKGDHNVAPPPVTIYRTGYMELSGRGLYTSMDGAAGYIHTILTDANEGAGLEGLD